VWPFPPRPIRPDVPPELIAELELFSRDKLIDIRSYPHQSIPLIYTPTLRKSGKPLANRARSDSA
jgi:hypothetical protein